MSIAGLSTSDHFSLAWSCQLRSYHFHKRFFASFLFGPVEFIYSHVFGNFPKNLSRITCKLS